MDIKTNPFRPNAIVVPTLFAGRDQQTIAILKKLNGVKEGMTSSFILHGEPGIGKTALAKLIQYVAINQTELGDLNFITSYYSAESGQGLKDIIEASLNNITNHLPKSALNNLQARLGNIFQDGKFSLGAFGAVMEIDKKDVAKNRLVPPDNQFFKDQIVSSLTNLMKAVIAKDQNSPKGLLIIIDEIHNIRDIDGAGQIFRNIINTLDFNEQGNFSFMLIGSSDTVDGFFSTDPSARRSFDFIPLDVMPTKDSEDLLIKGFERAEIDYNKKTLKKKIVVAGGYPHALQMLGYNLIDIDSDNHIDESDWGKAIDITAQQLQSKDFYSFYSFTGKPNAKDEIMNILALANGADIYKKTLAKALNVSVYRNASQLIKQGAIKEDQQTGKLSLQSELLRTAINFHIYKNKLVDVAQTKVNRLQMMEP